MRTQEVLFMEPFKLTEEKEVDFYFTPEDAKKFTWLQRLCINTLQRLGTFKSKKEVVTTKFSPKRIPIHYLDMVPYIKDQIVSLQRDYNVQAVRVLIGGEEYNSISGMLGILPNFSYFYSDPKTLLGLTVEVIPWMKGIVVMPKSPPVIQMNSY